MHNAPALVATCSDFQSTSSASVNASELSNLEKALRWMSSAFVTISPTYSKRKVPLHIFFFVRNPQPFSLVQKTSMEMHNPFWTTVLPQELPQVQESLHSWRKNLLTWLWQVEPRSSQHSRLQNAISSVNTYQMYKSLCTQYQLYKSVQCQHTRYIAWS